MAKYKRRWMACWRRTSSTQRAFTLIEIILVVLILTVIAGLAAPNLSRSLTKHQFEKSADELFNLMRYAQSRAITQGHDVRLVFNDDYTEYWLSEDAEDKSLTSPEAEFSRVPGRMGLTRRIPESIRVQSEEKDHLTFYPDGQIDRAEFAVCKGDRCKVVSTRIQRGFIRSFDSEDMI